LSEKFYHREIRRMRLTILFVLLLASTADAFLVQRPTISVTATCSDAATAMRTTEITSSTRILAGKKDDDDKLSRLGYSQEELQRSKNKDNKDGDVEKVNVNLIPDIDAVTLTAVGFALIAFNFFVFANLGDGGIAGTVATIMNLSRQ